MNQNQITFKQYRAIDLGIFAILLALTQSVILVAAKWMFPDQLYIVSPVAAVTALVMMRWGGWGLFHAALGGAVFCAVSGGTGLPYAIYCVGNLLSAVALLLLKRPGKKKIREDSFLSITFAFAVQALMLLGRAAMALAMGQGMDAAVGFIASDSLSFLFTLLIIWIVRRIDGLFEDQKTYLLRTQNQ